MRSQDGYCHVNNVTNAAAKISSYVNVTNSRDALKAALAFKGPISVGIDASHKSLSFYANGVYYEPACGKCLNNLEFISGTLNHYLVCRKQAR